MNSYPPELLAQLAPVMFVAGLEPPPKQLPQEQDAVASAPDAFQVLAIRLREALLSQRKVAIWQPDKSKTFQVVLVDKDVRFPPRKLVPPEDPQYSNSHSPLSPLTPSSPLFPDGIIAPIWIRKHTTLVPSVFVIFMRIFEFPPHVLRSPLEGHDSERERLEEERRRDTDLAAEIAQRKKGTNDRGVKLTVVLMASRRLLDDPSLDSRLTFIRRHSGLDSRAALFVLSPVSTAELQDFVRSLQQALYEPALEYYTAHSKRVRRKRNRHSQAVASYPNPAAALVNPNIARPLRPEGWTVRYEYKMACFAEFRGEDEVALKHYQDAYATLTIMFGSTAILPPRTKRWAEAKVLADCINIKIVKLYLYNNEHALALSHHNTHIRQFSDFSRGWGIGEETYEFWSWVARQYRVLAELMDQGTRAGLVIPIHKPAAQNASRTIGVTELDIARTLGVNPSHALQHSGYYYYMAAKCTEMRRARFVAALEAEQNNSPISLSPGFSNEKKVDHLALVLELYTKSYELFKRHSPTPSSQATNRLTSWIAYRIAETHYEAGKFDTASRFFERIAKTYRKEGWYPMLNPLLSRWYSCAQRMGDVELSIKLLLEMMGQDLAESEDPNALEEDLLAVFQSTVPISTDEPLSFDISNAKPLFESKAVFWKAEVEVEEAAAFQISIASPAQTVISSVPISSLEIYFAHLADPLIVTHQPADVASSVSRVDLGVINLEGELYPEVSANLRLNPGAVLIFTGSLVSAAPATLSIQKLVCNLEQNTWRVKVPLDPHVPRVGSTSDPRWLRCLDPPQFIAVKRPDSGTTIVKPRPHLFSVSVLHQEPAFLDENYPIVIEVVNFDNRNLEIIADVLLQPTDIDYAVNSISANGETSTGLIKDISFGVLAPGVHATKTLTLSSGGAAGSRLLDISISAHSPQPDGATDTATGEQTDELDDPASPTQLDKTIYQQTIVVPTVAPFAVSNDVSYVRDREEWPGPASLGTFEDESLDPRKGTEALVNVTFTCAGPWSVYIENIALETVNAPEVKVTDCSIGLADGSLYPAEYLSGDEIQVFCNAKVGIRDDGKSEQYLFPSPGRYIVTWRRVLKDGSHGNMSTTVVALPALTPPMDELVALFDLPASAKLHTSLPLTVTVRNYHPTRSANVTVQLEPDIADGFIVAGLRSGRVPVLLPGGEEKLTWTLIPLECGYQPIPRIKVLDRRKAIPVAPSDGAPQAEGLVGEPVKVVDLRRDQRRVVQAETEGEGGDTTDTIDSGTIFGSILVLP
ncbi:hypothetical protein MD484_g1826, partial [Candolleomyces efflorescens]